MEAYPPCPAAWNPPVPDGQEPDSGAHGQCALREDGRKQMTSDVTPEPKPMWSHSKIEWTPRLLSDSKRVICVSHGTVPFKCQDRYPAGQLWKHSSGFQSGSQDHWGLLICWVLWTQRGRCNTRCSMTHRDSWHRCRESPRMGETANCLFPLLVSLCPVSGSGPRWGMYWLYPSP